MTNQKTLLSVLTLASAALATAAEPVAFESFTYTGRDSAFEAPLPDGHYRNPILAGYYPDPSICRVGEDYYLINSSFAHFPGIPIFHSRDLVNWKQLGHVIDRPDQLKYDGLGITRGIFAPAISHHDGTFYVICTMVDAGGNFLMTAQDPAGPWSDPIWLDFDGIDPSLFFDDDGRAWIVNNGNPPDNQPLYQGHRAIWIQEFDYQNRKMVGPRRIIVNGGADISTKPVWIEGPHLYKREGWYYLCCAEGGTSWQHSQVILRGKSPTGPFEPWSGNPILTQRDLDGSAEHAVTCTGHADLEIGPDGQWWAVFLACRPYAPDRWATGRETFLLPVTWTADGWPQILPHGERVPYVVKGPEMKGAGTPATGPTEDASGSTRSYPLTGNFTVTDGFAGAALAPNWIMIRTPHERWWSLGDGALRLLPRPDRLSGSGNPSFWGRRLQHSRFDASTRLRVPATPGTSAGLAISQNETHTYYFAVQRTEGGLSAFVEVQNGPKPQTLITGLLPDGAREIELRITGNEENLSFAYSADSGEWKDLLPRADSYPISVQAAGGGLHFTGALIGPHARVE